jgi:hypothetical protein
VASKLFYVVRETASGPQIAAAVGWPQHIVRGFLAGLAKKGIVIESSNVSGRIGLNKQGAKGSFRDLSRLERTAVLRGGPSAAADPNGNIIELHQFDQCRCRAANRM